MRKGQEREMEWKYAVIIKRDMKAERWLRVVIIVMCSGVVIWGAEGGGEGV